MPLLTHFYLLWEDMLLTGLYQLPSPLPLLPLQPEQGVMATFSLKMIFSPSLARSPSSW